MFRRNCCVNAYWCGVCDSRAGLYVNDPYITMHCSTSIFTCLSVSQSVSQLDYRQARFPFKRNRLLCVRCVRCVNENRKKRKRLRWQAANHGCQRKRLRLNGNRTSVNCRVAYGGRCQREVTSASNVIYQQTGKLNSSVTVSQRTKSAGSAIEIRIECSMLIILWFTLLDDQTATTLGY